MPETKETIHQYKVTARGDERKLCSIADDQVCSIADDEFGTIGRHLTVAELRQAFECVHTRKSDRSSLGVQAPLL